MPDARPWKLVAPWYHWQRQIAEGVARTPRETRPVFQKFDSPDFVRGFLKDPQRSLRFKEEVDRVFNVNLVAAPLLSGGIFAGKSISLYAPRAAPGQPPIEPKQPTLVPTGIRKLYLDTHKRYYLVVCELHCDAPGFPNTTPDQVCQAGFVVRRRYLKVPAAARKEALALLRRIVALEAQVAELDETAPLRPRAAQRRHERVERLKQDGTFALKRAELIGEIAARKDELQAWKDENGVEALHEGWIPGRFDGIGEWRLVEETPQALIEATFPLFPLFADPDAPTHDARGRAIFFGVVPTSSLDTDERGQPRFDARVLYEIRCFVRRHQTDCPRKRDAPDCPGELVWSEPTEPFRLASQSDLVGTSNRPITIQVPDLAELAAQANVLPFGRFSPVRVIQPQSLNPRLSGTSLASGEFGGQAICFFAIPLITIIALFVIKLFLPIVVFLFGLWFLLAFKFCIPPSFQVDAAIQAALEVTPPNVDADFSVSLNGKTVTAASLNAELKAELSAGIAAAEGIAAADVSGGLDVYANTPLIQLNNAMVAEAQITTPEMAGPQLLADLEYEPRVTAEVRVS